MNEVATDYNAGFTGALARLAREFGGAPLANFPQPEAVVGNEIFAEAAVNASGTNFTEIRRYLNNQSGWPARMGDRLSFRYYFTLEPGVTPGQITLTANFNQCTAPSAPDAAFGQHLLRHHQLPRREDLSGRPVATTARKCSSASRAPAPGIRPTTGRITGVTTTPGAHAGAGAAHPGLRQRRARLRHRAGRRATRSRRRRPPTCASPPRPARRCRSPGMRPPTTCGVTGYQVFRGTTARRQPDRPHVHGHRPHRQHDLLVHRARGRRHRQASAASAAVTGDDPGGHAGLHAWPRHPARCPWRAARAAATSVAITRTQLHGRGDDERDADCRPA